MVSLIRVTFKRARVVAADVATERAAGATAAEEAAAVAAAEEAAAAAGLAPMRKPFFMNEVDDVLSQSSGATPFTQEHSLIHNTHTAVSSRLRCDRSSPYRFSSCLECAQHRTFS